MSQRNSLRAEACKKLEALWINQPPEHRYRFIELIAYWEGRINTSHLLQQFGLSRPQASADINAYQQLAPGSAATIPWF